jgi:hypothetical protein
MSCSSLNVLMNFLLLLRSLYPLATSTNYMQTLTLESLKRQTCNLDCNRWKTSMCKLKQLMQGTEQLKYQNSMSNYQQQLFSAKRMKDASKSKKPWMAFMIMKCKMICLRGSMTCKKIMKKHAIKLLESAIWFKLTSQVIEFLHGKKERVDVPDEQTALGLQVEENNNPRLTKQKKWKMFLIWF